MLLAKILLFFVCHLLATISGQSEDNSNCATGTKCHCQSTVGLNCTAANLLPQSSRIPHNRRDYRFDYNGAAFKGTLNEHNFKDYANMEWLSLRHNNITKITGTTFNHSPLLETLDLSFNSLTTLPAVLFNNIPDLDHFYCSDNLLTTIDQHIFQSTTKLSNIRLYNNRLISVHPQAFANIVNLQELYLEQNQLETAYWSWFKNFNHTKKASSIELDGNNWSCDCRMKNFLIGMHAAKWMTTNKTGKEVCLSGCRLDFPRCHSPQKLKSRPLSHLSKKQLKCVRPKFVGNRKIKLKEGGYGSLKCTGRGTPTPKVEIFTKSGQLLASGKGNASFFLQWVELIDAGRYTCVMSGYLENASAVTYNRNMTVKVLPRNISGEGLFRSRITACFAGTGLNEDQELTVFIVAIIAVVLTVSLVIVAVLCCLGRSKRDGNITWNCCKSVSVFCRPRTTSPIERFSSSTEYARHKDDEEEKESRSSRSEPGLIIDEKPNP